MPWVKKTQIDVRTARTHIRGPGRLVRACGVFLPPGLLRLGITCEPCL